MEKTQEIFRILKTSRYKPVRLSKNDIHFHQHISDTINHKKKAIKENAMALS